MAPTYWFYCRTKLKCSYSAACKQWGEVEVIGRSYDGNVWKHSATSVVNMLEIDVLQRFLSIPRSTSYPPQPDPRMTRRCWSRRAVELKFRHEDDRGLRWAPFTALLVL